MLYSFHEGTKRETTEEGCLIFNIVNSLNKHSQGVQHTLSMNSTNTKQSGMSSLTASAKAGKL